MSVEFFPDIVRSTQYVTRADGNYYEYSHYRGETYADCQNRCVYCDVVSSELGFEGLVLDHFRPQKKFPNLINNPSNLVSSCQKCNRLKSDHWPIDVANVETHDDVVGFIDPFLPGRAQYFQLESSGKINANRGPATYLIGLLLLNRESRKLVRRKRIVRFRLNSIFERLDREIDNLNLILDADPGENEREKIRGRLREMRELSRSLIACLAELN